MPQCYFRIIEIIRGLLQLYMQIYAILFNLKINITTFSIFELWTLTRSLHSHFNDCSIPYTIFGMLQSLLLFAVTL